MREEGNNMPTQEDRITTLEQTTVSRIDFIDAMNRLTLQQAQMASDMSHQVTILLGVTASQGQDIRTIKGDVSTLKGDVSVLKADVSILKEDVSVLKADVSILKEDVSVLKADVSILKGDVSVLKADVSILKGDVSVLKADVSILKGDVSTLTEHLGRLETKFDEHTSLLTQILARLPEKP
jgi:chromosome segregation ATPase